MGNVPAMEVGGRKVRVTRLLSEGRVTHVYKAVDVDRKDFALKMVRIPRGRSGQLADEKVAERAVIEQAVMRSLPTYHPNIVKFHDAGITKADNEIRYFILSEYCPSNVSQKMSCAAVQGNLLPEAEVLLVFRDTLMAVLYLHSRNPPIAHRDVKVDNLLVGRDGLIKLCGFGSCSTTHRVFHLPKDIQAAYDDIRRNTTLAYRSPEQVDVLQGHLISEKVDIWALGVILFKLAFSQTPFEDSKGNVDLEAIIKGLEDRKIPLEGRSSGLISLIRCCLVVEPERRPTIGQVLKLCDEFKTRGTLPDWPGFNSSPRTPPDSPPSSPRPWDVLGGDESSANSIPAWERGTNESGGSSGGGGGGGGGSGILVASARRSQRVTRTSTGSGDTTWMARVGDGMRSKLYKLMGGEQRKRLWVLKTTSQNSTGPQPKYVGKIVAALWERELTMESVFVLLRDRPLAESPVVAMKALITLMKVLQQGPPHVLSECTTYASVVEEIGQMWGPIASGGDNKTKGVEAGGVVDPALSLLILRCATMIAQKIRFHEHHPEYRGYWSADSGNDANTTPTTYDNHNSFRLPEHDASDEPRTLQVISDLLIVQGSILTTMTEAFTLLGKGARDAGPSTRSALLPLMAESYLTYFATTRVLLDVSEKYSTRPRARPEKLVALAQKYETDLKIMRELYSRADGVEEVAVMKRTPRLPGVSPLSEGGAKRFREMSRKSSRQSTFVRASSKMEALKTLQDEERRFIDSNSSKLADGHHFDSEGEEDDGVSDDDGDSNYSLFAKESDHDHDHDAGGAGGGGVGCLPLAPRVTYGQAGAAGVAATPQAPTPPPYHLFAKALDATAIKPGQAASVKDSDVYGREDNGPWEDGTDDSSRDGGEDAVGARRKDDFSASSLDGSPSHGSAVGKGIPQLVQDPFLPGAAERVGSEVEFPLTFPKAFNSWVGVTGEVGTQQTRAGAAGGAAEEGSGDIRSAGGGRNVNPGSKTGGSLGGDSSNAGRDLSSGISSAASAMLEEATKLAQNCQIPLVSEAATLMSLIVKLVSDSRDNIRGIEKRLARCRSVITLLGNATKVIGKGADSKGEAERHMFDDVRDAIVDLVDLIKTYQSRNRLSKVLTSSVLKRREEEANLAIDRAILRSNWSMVANLVEAVRPGPEGSGPCVDGQDEYKVESVSDSSAASRRARRQRKLDQIEIPEDEVSISDELLGKGGFGAVYIGDYLGRNVACKVLQIKHGLGGVDDGGADGPSTMTDSEKRQRKAWLRELEAMIRLRSPHIVHVFGKIASRKDRLVLVMELLVGGDLRLLLKKSKPRLPEEQCRGIIGDVCAGMAFLHSKDTVYGDLKSANVLLDGDGRAKIGDFGTSRWAHHTNSTGLATYTTELGHSNKFSLAWSAPEVLNSEGSTMESDVYSFGVVVWEVVTTELPWANKKPLEIYCAVLGGRRPDFPLDTPAFIADVARRCWAGKADERPTFRAIMKDLR